MASVNKVILVGNLEPVICPICSGTFMRTKKQVNAVVKRSGKWTCKPCTTSTRNKAMAKAVGHKRIHKQSGYVDIKTVNGWRREHIVIAEKIIGRTLLRSEAVHHKNGIKTDNRPENLEVMDHGKHTKAHHQGASRIGSALMNIREGISNRATTRLTPDSVRDARTRAGMGQSQRSIATDFGVSPMTINRAVRGLSWRNI